MSSAFIVLLHCKIKVSVATGSHTKIDVMNISQCHDYYIIPHFNGVKQVNFVIFMT